MQWFSDWWDTLGLIRQILYCIAIPGTLLLIIQTVLVAIGFGGAGEGVDFTDTSSFDGVPDLSGGFDGDISGAHAGGAGSLDGGNPHDFGALGFFTLQGVVAFLCVFGWSGILFLNAFGNAALSLILAFILGFLAMAGVARIIRLSGRLAQNGTLNMKLLIGEPGVVYIPIPEDKHMRGKVTVQTSERMVECDAISETGSLPINTPVRVTDILAGNVLVVERMD